MIYELQDVTKVYEKRIALDLERLSLREGEIYALLGPNGSGKTTLLRILALLDAPSTGRVFFDSREVCFRESKLRPLRRNVVMVNQRPIMFSTTVYQNLAFGLKIRKTPRWQQRKTIERVLEMVGLSHLSGAQAGRLSGGETQRIAIARALALAPRVILCDEPVANVDLEHQSVVVNLLRQINREKKITIVFTTHDRLLASSLADHSLYLDRGRLVDLPANAI